MRFIKWPARHKGLTRAGIATAVAAGTAVAMLPVAALPAAAQSAFTHGCSIPGATGTIRWVSRFPDGCTGGGFGAQQGNYPPVRIPRWGDVSKQQRDASVHGLANCFWVPRTYIGNTGYDRGTDWLVDNGLFDTHAMFFTSAFDLVKGESLIIHGTYPRARFMTVVSYPLLPGEGFTLAPTLLGCSTPPSARIRARRTRCFPEQTATPPTASGATR